MEGEDIVDKISERFRTMLRVHAIQAFLLGKPARALDRMSPVWDKTAPVQRMTLEGFVVRSPKLVDEAALEFYNGYEALFRDRRIDHCRVGAIPARVPFSLVVDDEGPRA